jgi:hypothetical protein
MFVIFFITIGHKIMLSNILNLCPRVLRRRSATARSLGLRIRMLSGSLRSVSLECWAMSIRGLCDGPILVQRSPIECDVSKCMRFINLDNEAAWAPVGLWHHKKKKLN